MEALRVLRIGGGFMEKVAMIDIVVELGTKELLYYCLMLFDTNVYHKLLKVG
jgi:hypothetical protein